MIPGITSKLSETVVAATTSIDVVTDVLRINSTASTTALTTLVPHNGGFSQVVFIVNSSGANITTTTTGNIISGSYVIANNTCVPFVYSLSLDKWLSF